MELIADVAADGQTEVSVLLPHRVVSGIAAVAARPYVGPHRRLRPANCRT